MSKLSPATTEELYVRTASDPVVHGNHVVLRPIVPSDYLRLFAIATDPRVSYRWRFRGASPSFEEFVGSLTDRTLVHYVVVSKHNEEIVGLVTAYASSQRDRYCYLGVLGSPEYRGSGAVFQGVVLFIDYLFKVWDLRKIYMESLEFNFASFRSGVGRYFEIEGVLVSHEYYDGQYWNLYVLATTRELWASKRERLLKLVGVGKGPLKAEPQTSGSSALNTS